MAIICVGTPGMDDGNQNTTSIKNVASEIGTALKSSSESYPVVIRSTLVPGTVSGILIPILEAESGKKVDKDFDVCLNPEFLREGTSISDYYDPPLIIIGARRPEAAHQILELFKPHASIPCFVTSIETAEMIKCACNAFHALKVAFANEIGSLCKISNIDGREVMEILCADRKLNIADTYLKPAFAFGGSCLPKDLKALEYHAHVHGCEIPLLRSIIPSNTLHIERTMRLISDTGRRSIGLLGLSFKPGSDDLRESPLVALAKSLLDKGLELRVFDEDLRPENLLGTNRSFISDRIPNLSRYMVGSLEELFSRSDLVIVGKLTAESLKYLRNNIRDDLYLVDLIGIGEKKILEHRNYNGVCW
jgi:GDP-mannose 6-dehydrogenase